MERFKLSFIKEDACGKCDENGGEHHVSERLQGVPRPERIFIVVRVKVTVYQNGAPNGKSYAAKYGKDQICRHDFFCFHMKSPFCLVLGLYSIIDKCYETIYKYHIIFFLLPYYTLKFAVLQELFDKDIKNLEKKVDKLDFLW